MTRNHESTKPKAAASTKRNAARRGAAPTTKRAKVEAPIPYVPTRAPEREAAVRADAGTMPGPGDGLGCFESRPVAELAMERQAFTIPHRYDRDHRMPLGSLLREKLGNGWGTSSGRGVAAGAMRTVLGGLELVRVVVGRELLDDVSGDAVDDLLNGLRELGQLAVEIEDRSTRASDAAAADIACQSKAVAS